MAKVFIGNLSDDAKGSDVEDFFRKYGRLREITLKNGFGKLKKLGHLARWYNSENPIFSKRHFQFTF